MLAIGRALMASPRLILADEMSQGLAPVIVQEVYRRLLEVNRRGVTILLVEQNARLAFKLAQFVYVMEQGRVALEGRPPSRGERARPARLPRRDVTGGGDRP